MRVLVAGLLALLASLPAAAAYDEECHRLAVALARDPVAMTIGDLDTLKSCLSQLQSAGVNGPAQLPVFTTLLCPPVAAAPAPSCPSCPTAAQLCPRAAEEAPRQRTYIPRY